MGMEYVYAALLLAKAGKEISEENMKNVLEAAGVSVDEAQVKATVAALEGVDIEEVIKEASSMTVATPAAPAAGEAAAPAEEKKEEKKEEEKKDDTAAAAGLGALFG